MKLTKNLKVKNNIIDVKGKISGFPYGGYIQDMTSIIGGYIYIDKVSDYYYIPVGLADATACFNMCASGVLPLTWFYSNGISEEITTLARMTSLYQAIGSFRTSNFSIEARLKTQIKDITVIKEFDIDALWTENLV